jgi:Arylsulfotransferase (ASST)
MTNDQGSSGAQEPPQGGAAPVPNGDGEPPVVPGAAGQPGPRSEPPEERLISRRALLASAGLVAGTAVVTAAGLQLAGSSVATPAPSTAPSDTPGSAVGPSGSPNTTPSPDAGASPTPTPPPPGPRLAFQSRPDLRPPALLFRTRTLETAPGLLLLTPNNGDAEDGPTIYEESGELVWMRPDTAVNVEGIHATDLRVVELDGAPLLCWWEGTVNGGIGDGDFVLVDASYQEVLRVATPGGGADLHEFLVTPQGTALYFVDHGAPPPTGSKPPLPSQVMDCAIVEVDLATGKRLFEWHSVDHIALDETYIDPPQEGGGIYDYVHSNSIEVDTDGTLLMSARNTCAVYKIDKASGRIVWRLGGKRSDFAMGDGADFGWQHDARRQADGTLTIFDDRQPPEQGRGIVLRLDETAMTATLVREYARPDGLEVSSQGNMQLLPNGNVLVGWGSQPVFTEFTADGRIVLDVSLPAGKQSYRDIRATWEGFPAEAPALAIDRVVAVTSGQHRVNAYASWNGATAVSAWRLLAGPSGSELRRVADIPRSGFETAISEVIPATATWVAVAALDRAGNVLSTSDPVAATAS